MEQVLYKLPDGWEWKRIEEVFTITSGKNLTKKDMDDEGKFSVYGGNGIAGRYNDFNLSGSNIIIGRVGALCGNVRLVNGDIWVTDNAFFIKEYKVDILKEYLAQVLAALNLGETANKAAQPVISYKGIKDLVIPYPPLDEQKRIVKKLDALLNRIDTAIEHLQESVTLADALYASTINEQMMQAIELAGLSTVEKHIEQIQTGTTPPTKQPEFYENGDINWFAPSDFGDHDILFDSNKKLSQKAFDAGKARKFDAGTIMLVAIGATIGKIGYLEQDASSNQQITGMKFNSAIIPRYAYYWFRFIKPEILTNASTATLPIINQKGIKALSFCAPNKQLQETICRKIDEVSNFRNKVKAELNEKVELMRSLKASILDSAFKGEL
ncbi:restriction endonuclease subunit S [Vibrio parahaemolyticus]|nr:restriction endonuclease subunit S [Vibrio parahaemolyticus]